LSGQLDLETSVAEFEFRQALCRLEAEAGGPPALAAPMPDAVSVPPAHIGRYRILRTLGTGGMGVVYEAEQENPRRTVALKVVRPGVASPDLVHRFTREAHLLGRLQHPGIAQVYEAGLDADGQAFFAMELIHGLPLVEYARRHSLNTAARLGLVAQVCEAVQHAHDRGIIHRDLKPDNILVDETGQPKVLDFGVARVTDADLQTATGRTEVGQLIGTLAYMSPEQIEADPAALDGRSDVYALGVILFELLVERLPYAVAHLPLAEAARVVHEGEPLRLGSVNSLFRGDVEIIAAKALAKEKARRYATAAELAADIRRYLNHDPILARPPSALYHLRKFARRHKALVGGAAAVLVALLGGLVATTTFALREAEQRRHADEQRQKAVREASHARVAAAAAALRDHDVAAATAHLLAVPLPLRAWEWRHFHSRLDDSAAVFPAPAGGLQWLASGPKELRPRTVAADADGQLSLIDETGVVQLCRTAAANGRPRNLAVSPDQKFLAVAWGPVAGPGDAREGSLWIYDLSSGEPRAARGGHPEYLNSVAFSPDGTRVAGATAGHVSLWDAKTGAATGVVLEHPELVNSVAFDPAGRRVATACEDRNVRLWDAATGAAVGTPLSGHTAKVYGVAFAPDGATIVSASADGTVRQWEAATGQRISVPYRGHGHEVLTAVYSPDGRLVASAGQDGTVRLWQATDGQDELVLNGHSGHVFQLAFRPDGQRLASASIDGTVRVWETGSLSNLFVLRGHTDYVYPVAYSPDGWWIASGSWDHTVRLWDAVTREPAAELTRHTSRVGALAFSPDGAWLVSGSRDGQIQLWDVATAAPQGPAWQRLPRIIEALAYSPDGRRIASGAGGGDVRLWESATGQEIARLEGPGDAVFGLAYSPDGRLLAGACADHRVYLSDAHTHRLMAVLQGHTDVVHSVAFSPDGRRLVSAGLDRTVRLWDPATGAPLADPSSHSDQVFTAVFHPDGTRLASGGRDGVIRLWDVLTREEVARLQGHTDYVYSLAFSPDGTTLASGSGDSTVRLWDTVPPADRFRARREAEAPRRDAEERVERLFREFNESARVVQVLRADKSLSDPLRREIQRAIWRRVAPPK
jgi:WD40 repeat protein/predicted Ser/Thr protein kinase